MISNNKPDFKKVMRKSDEVLVSSHTLESFPFSAKRLIKEKSNLKVKTFGKAGSYGVDIESFGSKDAILMNMNGRKIIFINERIQSKSRQKFSTLHEWGHHYLNHDLSDKESYGKYEVETNFFTAQLLMPEQVINELKRRGLPITKKNLIDWFGVSEQAAEKRLKTLRKIDFSKRSIEDRELDDLILLKYKDFIDKIAPIRSDFYDYDYEEEMQNTRNDWLY